MTSRNPTFWTRRNVAFLVIAFFIGAGVMTGIGVLLLDIQQHKTEALQFPLKILLIPQGELDPAVWGRDFAREYNSFMQTKDDTIQTPYGGSIPFDKLQRYPVLTRLYAGYPFSVQYNKARGHYYSLIDQKETKRIQVVNQPGACANCHASETPALITQMGWEAFNKGPYNSVKDMLHTAVSCNDCHDPQTMNLRISRPAFINAMKARGVDVNNATRQEMRTFVCAQCHVEYYFSGDNKVLTFPWTQGLSIDNIQTYYEQISFTDWTHKETNAPMIKIQHPEFEMWSSGVHARAGVACADCHMAYVRDGAVKVSDHWVRSPLANISKACQPCHRESEDELKARVATIQNTTAELLQKAEKALTDASDSIQGAQNAGATDADLKNARTLYRNGSMRWDFAFSENSTGFHSPQESARILGNAIDLARQAQVAAERVGVKYKTAQAQ